MPELDRILPGNGIWKLVSTRDIIFFLVLLTPGLVGYLKVQNDVNTIKSTYVSQEQLNTTNATSDGSQAVQNEQIRQLKAQNEVLHADHEALRKELERLNEAIARLDRSRR